MLVAAGLVGEGAGLSESQSQAHPKKQNEREAFKGVSGARGAEAPWYSASRRLDANNNFVEIV